MTKRQRLDLLFSQYIRLKSADARGYCKCYTCGRPVFWTEIQNGHYIPRANTITRWDTTNCHPQCVECNEFRHGNIEEYRKALIREYGTDVVEELERARWRTARISDSEIDVMIEHYKVAVAKLRKEKFL